MPAKSPKQYRFMQMIANSKSSSDNKGIGPSKEVAEEFIKKTPAKKRRLFMKQKKD